MKSTITLFLALTTFAVACKKEVKPDETASTATAATASVPPPPTELPDAGEVMDSAIAPLASIEAPKKIAPAKPKADPPECVQARSTCSNPNVGVNGRVKALCDTQKALCTKAGGKV